MSREVKQIIETDDTVTVIVESDSGYQYSGSCSIGYYGKADAISRATQEALNK